jgi:hypothetical protein
MKNRSSKAKLSTVASGGDRRHSPAAAAVPSSRPQVMPAVPDILRVDGKRVAIEGVDEIELRCGEASITLRRNGKIILKGTFLESSSKGVNRIKGGAIKIN